MHVGLRAFAPQLSSAVGAICRLTALFLAVCFSIDGWMWAHPPTRNLFPPADPGVIMCVFPYMPCCVERPHTHTHTHKDPRLTQPG